MSAQKVAYKIENKLSAVRRSCSVVAARTGRQIVDSVLLYFERLERAARIRNMRREYQHLEDCWMLVHSAFYGFFQVPPMASTEPKAYPVQILSERPAWFNLKFSRPMRRVEDRKTIKGREFLILECSHKVPALYTGDTRKHVRCEDCRKIIERNEGKKVNGKKR